MTNGFRTGSRNDGSIDLEGCLVQVDASKAWFTRRVLPLSIEQLRWRPEAQHWSIAQCLDHLNITLALYLPKVDQAIAAGLRHGEAPDGCPGLEPPEIEALKLIEPPVLIPIAAPPVLIPAPAVDPDQMVETFHQIRERYAESVRRAFGLDLPHIQIREPIYPRIRSLGGALAFMAAHDRRHMWQAEQIRNAPRFPQAIFNTLFQ